MVDKMSYKDAQDGSIATPHGKQTVDGKIQPPAARRFMHKLSPLPVKNEPQKLKNSFPIMFVMEMEPSSFERVFNAREDFIPALIRRRDHVGVVDIGRTCRRPA